MKCFVYYPCRKEGILAIKVKIRLHFVSLYRDQEVKAAKYIHILEFMGKLLCCSGMIEADEDNRLHCVVAFHSCFL